jgi:DNA-binding transcriptional MocR family regulator
MPAKYCSYTPPSGGMFLWLTFHNLGELNKDLTSFDLFKILCDAGVICVPGDDFLVPDIRTHLQLQQTAMSVSAKSKEIAMRVTFAASSPVQIRAAVEKMAACIIALAEKK